MEATMKRKFKVKTMDGRESELETDHDISIQDLKTLIETKLSIPVHRQRLIFKSKLLKDNQKLNDYLTKDDEIVHLMAMSEEQARTRSRTRTEATNPANQPGGMNSGAIPNVMGQGDPLQVINAAFGNILGGLNQRPGGQPGGQGIGTTQMNFGTFDLGQLLGGRVNQGQSPASNNTNRSQNRPTAAGTSSRNPPTATRLRPTPPQRTSVSRGRTQPQNSEETKERRSTSGTRTTEVTLPHPHLYEINLICNQLMGENSAFPGPPLPPTGQPRTPISLLGGYLGSLQFAMQRTNSFIWRSGELLNRERHMVNPMERAEAQHLINQTGRAMEHLARALLLSSHYYRDLTISENPGHYRLSNRPHPDFAELNNRFADSQFRRTRRTRSEAATNSASSPQTMPPPPSSEPAPASERIRVTRQSRVIINDHAPPTESAPNQTDNQPNPPPTNNPIGGLLQNLMSPGGMENIMGMVGNFTQQLQQNRQPPVNQPTSSSQANQPTSSTQANQSTSSAQANQPTPSEESENRTNASSPHEPASSQSRDVNMEQEENKAERVQQNINSNMLNMMSNLTNLPNNPLGTDLSQAMQGLLGSVASGGNIFNQTLRELSPDDTADANTFLSKILNDCTLQDLLAIFNGNFEVVTSLHPRMRDTLFSDYMNREDTPERREEAAERITEEIQRYILIPESVRENIVEGSNPERVTGEINARHIRKMIQIILEIENSEENSTVFLNRMSRIMRWWIGDLIDSLKPCFTGELQDVLKFIRGNIEERVSEIGGENANLVGNMATDGVMNLITKSYNKYLDDKQREDEAEARELGISLEVLYQRRKNTAENSRMEVDEEPKIEEEEVKTINSQAPTITHATPLNSTSEENKETVKQEEEKVEEEKDEEIKALLEEMEEDQSMLVVNPPSKRAHSNAYKAIDSFYDRNIDTPNPITAKNPKKQDPKADSKSILKSALKDSGFNSSTIENNLKDIELPEDFVEHFKDVVKEEIQNRKKDPEYKEGRHPDLDKL